MNAQGRFAKLSIRSPWILCGGLWARRLGILEFRDATKRERRPPSYAAEIRRIRASRAPRKVLRPLREQFLGAREVVVPAVGAGLPPRQLHQPLCLGAPHRGLRRV